MMKKKISLFGREFSVLAIAVIGMMALASAALVPYLSNVITATVGVDSPMELEISNDAGVTWGDSIVLSDTFGGGVFAYKVKSTYKSDGPITMQIDTGISNSIDDATCADFDRLEVMAPTDFPGMPESANTWVNVKSMCNQNGDEVKISLPAMFGYVDGDEVQTYDVRGEFAINVAPAAYTIKTQAMMPTP